MKKLTVGLGTGLAAGLLAAAAVMNVGAAANGQTAAITEERAKEIAMDHAGVDGEDISYITVKTDYERLKGGKMQYLEASVGASFPIRYSYLSLGATWRKQLNTRSNLMQESLSLIHI